QLLPTPNCTFFPYTTLFRSAADDLLELGHRVDDPHKHNVLHRGGVDARSQQLRRGQDHGSAPLKILEMAEVSLADVPFVRRDPRSEEHTSELQSRENLVCRL